MPSSVNNGDDNYFALSCLINHDIWKPFDSSLSNIAIHNCVKLRKQRYSFKDISNLGNKINGQGPIYFSIPVDRLIKLCPGFGKQSDRQHFH